MRIDHIVLWVADPARSAGWYQRVLGATPLRLDDFGAGKVMFPSVRLSDDAILDLMPLAKAPMMNAMAPDTAGHRVNHVCLAMSKDEYDGVRARLAEDGYVPKMIMKDSFGAGGAAPEAFYFQDPDGNVLEARYY